VVTFLISAPEKPTKINLRRFAVRNLRTGELHSDLYGSIGPARGRATDIVRYGYNEEHRKDTYEIVEFECVEVCTHIHAPPSRRG
jgi:hypothetical protein